MADSLISSEVDFEAAGRQEGYLRLPHSTDHSAYGWLPIPVVTIAGGRGPTVLIAAGVHGDEYEGQVAVARLARELTADQVQGRVILLPMTNLPAAEAGQRTSPIDGGNLNRAFPGDPHGTPTQMIAHYLETVLLPRCDIAIDLHSGGSSLWYPPTLLRGPGHDARTTAQLDKLQAAFDLPYTWIFDGLGGPASTGRTLMAAANRAGVTCVMAELGGGNAVTPDCLAWAERGLHRALVALGVLAGETSDAARGTRTVRALGTVPIRADGIFVPLRDIGDPVDEGAVVGEIHHPDAPWAEPDSVVSPFAGFVLAKRVHGRSMRGDAAFQIVEDRRPL
jgi:predicted deacylase